MFDLFNQMLAADKLPARPARRRLTRSSCPRKGFENILVYLLLPAWEKVAEADTRTRAACATGVGGPGVRAVSADSSGKWPDLPCRIPRDILPTVPTTRTPGSPLLYRVTDDGAVVYAVGKDLTDDGGIDLDPKGDPGTDIGFRLFDPQIPASSPAAEGIRERTLPSLPLPR